MVFVTLICPGCQKSTIVDDADDSSYCMHCGTRFDDMSVEEAEPLDPMIAAALEMTGALGEPYEPVDYTGEPWYPGVESIQRLISEGEIDDAVESLADLLDANPDFSPDIEICMREVVAGCVIDRIIEGEPYDGGAAEIARVISDYGGEDGPNGIVAALFYGIAQTSSIIRGAADASVLSESIFNLLMEYPLVEPDIREQLEMCTDFMHISGIHIDTADSVETDRDAMDEVRHWIYAMQDFVRILGDSIYDAVDPLDEETLDVLAERWAEADISTIGANVIGIADRFLMGTIDGETARREVDAYTSDYVSLS